MMLFCDGKSYQVDDDLGPYDSGHISLYVDALAGFFLSTGSSPKILRNSWNLDEFWGSQSWLDCAGDAVPFRKQLLVRMPALLQIASFCHILSHSVIFCHMTHMTCPDLSTVLAHLGSSWQAFPRPKAPRRWPKASVQRSTL